MFNFDSLLNETTKSKDELLENCQIKKTSFDDAFEIARLMRISLGLQSSVKALRELVYTNANLDESVKLVDSRDGRIYGFLILSDFTLLNGSNLSMTNPMMHDYLINFKMLNGFVFIIDKRLRGCGFDKQMLLYNLDFINKYDFIWCGVENTLKSHSYWKRLGFTEITHDGVGKFYILKTKKKPMDDIFIIKSLTESIFKNENHY